MKNWKIANSLNFENGKLNADKLINILLENRNIKTNSEKKEFLTPSLSTLTPKNLNISVKDLNTAKNRLEKAKKEKEGVIVYGDYDVDGITGTAILWENLNKKGFNVMPYIPSRTDEGYGLSIKGIDNLLKKYKETKLIITVDNGIVAIDAVDHASSLGIDVIITDHHVLSKKLPNAHSIIHSTKICGSAVAYVFAKEMYGVPNSYLELVALATVADVMKLTSYNRTLLIYGIKELKSTKRLGLLKMISSAGVEKEKIGVYEIGHVIGPRINAMGRIDEGMESLRLLCTTNNSRAIALVRKVSVTNTKRQEMTIESTIHAKAKSSKDKKIIVVSDKSYNPGVVGLISGRISQEFYKPSAVISEGKEISKGSARSVSGFNIIKFLRLAEDLLIDVGGHPGAAGFTIETKKIPEFKKLLEKLADKQIEDKLLIKKVRVDCELPIEYVNKSLFDKLQALAPFGFGNPEPVFADEVIVENFRFVGKERNHLKLELKSVNQEVRLGGIMFGVDESLKIEKEDKINIVYSIAENSWNGNKKIELKIKDLIIQNYSN